MQQFLILLWFVVMHNSTFPFLFRGNLICWSPPCLWIKCFLMSTASVINWNPFLLWSSLSQRNGNIMQRICWDSHWRLALEATWHMSRTAKPECTSPDECTRIEQPVQYLFCQLCSVDCISMIHSWRPLTFGVVFTFHVFRICFSNLLVKQKIFRLTFFKINVSFSPMFNLLGQVTVIWMSSCFGRMASTSFNKILQIAWCKAGTASKSYTCCPSVGTICSWQMIMLFWKHFSVGGYAFGVNFEMIGGKKKIDMYLKHIINSCWSHSEVRVCF